MIMILVGTALFALATPVQSDVSEVDADKDLDLPEDPLQEKLGMEALKALVEETYFSELGVELSSAEHGTSVSLSSSRVADPSEPGIGLVPPAKYEAALVVMKPDVSEPVVIDLPEPAATAVWVASDSSYRTATDVGQCPPPEGTQDYQQGECRIATGDGPATAWDLSVSAVWWVGCCPPKAGCSYEVTFAAADL